MGQSSHSRRLLKRNEDACLHQDLNGNIHGSVTHNSPKLETTQMSVNWRMEKLWYIVGWNTTQQEKETPMRDATVLDDSQEHYAKSSQTQKAAFCVIPFTQNSRKFKTRMTKQISCCQGLGMAEGKD